MSHSNDEPLFSVTKNDFVFETFRCPGNGGQKVNKTSSGVRCRHPESGAIAKSCDTPSQHSNKKIAFKRCVESDLFQRYLARRVADAQGRETVEQKVARMMDPEHIKVETKDAEGNWVENKC